MILALTLSLKIKLEKSNIIKLSDIFYVENLSFNIKHYMHLKTPIKKAFSLNLINNKESIKLSFKISCFLKINLS
jgi:hypothetical protein